MNIKFVIVISCFTVLLFVPHALAQTAPSGFTALAPIPGLTDVSPTSVVNADSLASFFNNLYKYLIGVAAVLAVIMITWGGLEIAFNRDDVSKITDSKGKIYNALYGLILVLSPALVFGIINPSILNLSLNLPELDTKSGAPVQTVSTTPKNTGKQITGSSNVMTDKLISCKTRDCAAEINTCMKDSNVRNASDYQVVCVNTDGTIATNKPSGDVGCPPDTQTLSVKCTTFSAQ